MTTPGAGTVAARTAVLCPTCASVPEDGPEHGSDDGAELFRSVRPALVPWLVSRSWFEHRTGCLESLDPLGGSVLHQDGDSALLHTLVDARHSGGVRRYQLVLGLRRAYPADPAVEPFGKACGGRWDGWWVYDAAADPALMTALLAAGLAPGPRGPRLELTGSDAADRLLELTPRPVSVQQSNTSVVYGEQLMLKLLRRPQPGTHPEAEILARLDNLGCRRSPRLVGVLRTPDAEQPPTVLGVLTDFLPNSGDGWQHALAQAVSCLADRSATALSAEGFAAQAGALGAAVAEVHTALARAFGSRRLTTDQVLSHTAVLDARLHAALKEAPALEPYAGRLAALYDDYAQVALGGRGIVGQRIHGDLHLGQTLGTADGWRIIDFEGEPERPLAERAEPQHVLRDVAGMFRSFDYVAQQALLQLDAAEEGPVARARLHRRAFAWTVRNRRAFAAGYVAGGGADPHCHPVVLRALEADKAVYEALYEARHRPAWLPIPLAAVRRLVRRR